MCGRNLDNTLFFFFFVFLTCPVFNEKNQRKPVWNTSGDFDSLAIAVSSFFSFPSRVGGERHRPVFR